MGFSILIPQPSHALVRSHDLDFVVAGGAGWIGRVILDILHTELGPDEFAHRVHVVGSSTRQFELKPGVMISSLALTDWRLVKSRPCILFHNAFLTRDKLSNTAVDEFTRKNREISRQVLEMSERLDARSIILPSSGAVYARDGALETDFERNPYGALKIEDERWFAESAKARGASIAIPRIFGLSGEYINKHELYMLASIIESLLTSQPVKIRAKHRVFRSYVYTADLIRLCMAIALSPGANETFDTAGHPIVEIEELARLAAMTLGVPDARIERVRDESLPDDRYAGDPKRIDALWARHGINPLSLSAQIEQTANYLRSIL